MVDAYEANNPVRTTEKSLEIIEWLQSNDSGRVTEIAEDLDIGKGTVHNHLSTLCEHRYVLKEDNEYKLSLKFLEIGGTVRDRIGLYQLAQPEMRKISETTGELVNLAVEDLGEGVVLRREQGEQALDIHTYVGARTPLHATAYGKVLLAYTPEERVEEILDTRGLPGFTDNTITEREEMFEELERIRENGHAFDDSERIEGVTCVAAPIKGEEGHALGAISISGPSGRIADEDLETRFPKLLSGATGSVELQLKY